MVWDAQALLWTARCRSLTPFGMTKLLVVATVEDIRGNDPPPTKWTISRRSPSCNGVCGHWSRGTMSRLSSIATRSGFMPKPSTSAPSVSADEACASPFIVKFIWSLVLSTFRFFVLLLSCERFGRDAVLPCSAGISSQHAAGISWWRFVHQNLPARVRKTRPATLPPPVRSSRLCRWHR